MPSIPISSGRDPSFLPTPRFRLTISGLMILVLYAAVALACVDFTRRLELEAAGMGLIVGAIGTPYVLVWLTLLVFQPGSRRDILLVFLFCLFFLAFDAMLTISLWGPMILPVPLRESLVPLFNFPLWLGTLFLMTQVVWLSRFFPVPCPHCGRRTMLPPHRTGGRPQEENRPWRIRPIYRRCASCGARQRAVRRADVVRSHRVELSTFSRRYDWIDASRPEDDEYWKWVDTSRWRTWAHVAWRSAFARLQRSGRTRPTPEPMEHR